MQQQLPTNKQNPIQSRNYNNILDTRNSLSINIFSGNDMKTNRAVSPQVQIYSPNNYSRTD